MLAIPRRLNSEALWWGDVEDLATGSVLGGAGPAVADVGAEDAWRGSGTRSSTKCKPRTGPLGNRGDAYRGGSQLTSLDFLHGVPRARILPRMWKAVQLGNRVTNGPTHPPSQTNMMRTLALQSTTSNHLVNHGPNSYIRKRTVPSKREKSHQPDGAALDESGRTTKSEFLTNGGAENGVIGGRIRVALPKLEGAKIPHTVRSS
ncbi:uncharacterized protein PpBr36_06177 [Pyricularia pennisetigena]|uniref:uncharacterized protein n=1 Tax=Pyricularia pennisetigena TaxID=1578925 RepID=UPI00115312BC|nr:uncharacterized protein PpBr36_06177 [Pyricularia pennisetigena]TLS22712.1 hypothetical protein PpBr36_06177 [Pyricularia pennisetigena]